MTCPICGLQRTVFRLDNPQGWYSYGAVSVSFTVSGSTTALCFGHEQRTHQRTPVPQAFQEAFKEKL